MTKQSFQGMAAGWFLATAALAIIFYTSNKPDPLTNASESTHAPSSLSHEEMINTLDEEGYVILTEQEQKEREETTTHEDDNNDESPSVENVAEENKDTKTEQKVITKVVFSIEKGMTSSDVSSLLEEIGIIDDATQFEKKLLNLKLTESIRTGQYILDDSQTLDEIIDEITSS